MTTNQLASSRDVMRSDYRLNNLSMKVFLLSNQQGSRLPCRFCFVVKLFNFLFQKTTHQPVGRSNKSQGATRDLLSSSIAYRQVQGPARLSLPLDLTVIASYGTTRDCHCLNQLCQGQVQGPAGLSLSLTSYRLVGKFFLLVNFSDGPSRLDLGVSQD